MDLTFIVAFVNPEFSKANFEIFKLGQSKFISLKFIHSLKVYSPIFSNDSGKFIFSRYLQPINAYLLIKEIVSGNVIFVIDEFLNASLSIPVTGYPFTVWGISIFSIIGSSL